MAYLQLKSTNPSLSYILKKNPASGLFARSMRKGTLFGFYSLDDVQTYNVFFKDAPNEISYPEFKDQEFEYINATRYNSTQFVLNALSELFRDAFKKPQELDVDGHTSSVLLNLVCLSSKRTLDTFTHHFQEECQIDAEQVSHKHYRMTFTTTRSIYYLLNLVNLFSTFNVIRSKTEFLFVDDETVEKYFQCLAAIDAPYFIRYEFKTHLLRGQRRFEKYQSLLENSKRYPMALKSGDSVEMRMDVITSYLNFNASVIDIGCGEGRYIWKIAPKLAHGAKYHAIDIDQDCLESVSHKVRVRELTNVFTYPSLDAFETSDALGDSTTGYDIILTEVIEHMSVPEATALVKRCLAFPKLRSLILTTPNKDFNHFYFDEEDGVRHCDHKFEFTAEEFMNWLQEFSGCFDYLAVGDEVNGIPMSLGAVLRKE